MNIETTLCQCYFVLYVLGYAAERHLDISESAVDQLEQRSFFFGYFIRWYGISGKVALNQEFCFSPVVPGAWFKDILKGYDLSNLEESLPESWVLSWSNISISVPWSKDCFLSVMQWWMNKEDRSSPGNGYRDTALIQTKHPTTRPLNQIPACVFWTNSLWVQHCTVV